jgi:hypothetical protein
VLKVRRVCLVSCERLLRGPKQTLTAHCYIISFGVCSELLPEDGRQGPKHVGDFIYIINLIECIRRKLFIIF